MAPPKSKRAKRKIESEGQANEAKPRPTSPSTNPSPIEQLPKELNWQLIEYAPEAVLNLRRACRALHSHVNEFARSPSIAISLMDTLEIYHWDWENERQGAADSTCVDIAMTVPPSKRRLFRLRRKLSEAPDGFMRRIRRPGSDGVSRLKVRPTDAGFVAHAGYCIGQRLGTKRLSLCNYPKMLAIPEVVKLIDDVQFTKLHVRNALADDAVTAFLDMLRKHKVDEVCLFVKEAGLSDPKSFLLELSSLVRSLYIHQNSVASVNIETNYLFGVANEEWGPAILDMFSGKLDKLRISNIYYSQFLSKRCSDMLREQLPKLGKQIWMEVSCRDLGEINEERNGHVIQVGTFNGLEKMRIKHCSRVNEEFRM